MAVKKGYKQTEVGVIPEDWDVTALGSISKIERGKFTARPRNDPKYYGGDIPFIQTGDVSNSSGVIRKYSQTLNELGLRVSKRFPRGTLFFTIAANIGDLAITEFDTACPDSLVAISPAKTIDQRWLYHELKRNKSKFEVIASSNAQSNLNLEKIKPFLVPLPPTLREQEAIAGALSDADAWIESLEQLIAKKRQIKQGAMQELLTGKRRLPGFSGKWETKRLGDLGRCQRGVSYNPSIDLFSGDTNSSVRLLRSNNVQDAKIVYSDIQFVASSRVSCEQYLQENDILICMANGSRDLVGKAGRYCEEKESAYTFGAFMGAFRPASEMANPVFCFYLFQTAAYRQHIAILLAGSSINNLTPDNLESHLVVVPNTLAEQSAIATVLSDMDIEIESLESKLAKAREVKQGMMQELLTGSIRLV